MTDRAGPRKERTMNRSAETTLMKRHTPAKAHTSVGVLAIGNLAAAAAAAAVGESSGTAAAGTPATATRGPNAVPRPPISATGGTDAAGGAEVSEVGGARPTCSAGLAGICGAGPPAACRAPPRTAGEAMVPAARGAAPATVRAPTMSAVDSARDVKAGPLRAFVAEDATATASARPAPTPTVASAEAVLTTRCTAYGMLGSDARRRADGMAEQSHSETWAEDSVPEVSVNPRTCESNARLMTTPAISASTSSRRH